MSSTPTRPAATSTTQVRLEVTNPANAAQAKPMLAEPMQADALERTPSSTYSEGTRAGDLVSPAALNTPPTGARVAVAIQSAAVNDGGGRAAACLDLPLRAASNALVPPPLEIPGVESGPVVPDQNWDHWRTPEAGGWSTEKLKLAQDYTDTLETAAVMIVHGGKVVAEWGDTMRAFKCHSIRKSILSALYGQHVWEGTIRLTSTLSELDIDDNAPSLTDSEKEATVSDLLKSRSGVFHPALYETRDMAAKRPKRGTHAPDTFWYYNNWDFNAAGAIFEKETKSPIFEEFEERLAGPLGMQDFVRADHTEYFREGTDSVHPAYTIQLSARDLARFGLLFARDGCWGDRQIIPHGWVVQSTRPYSTHTAPNGAGYGYMWWTPPLCNVTLPDGAFWADGLRGHKVLVIPQWDLVIVHRVNTFEPKGWVSTPEFGTLVKRILDARL